MYLCTKIVRFPAHLVRRGFILAGGAFNAPIAGIVFAFEEVGRSFEKDNAGTIIRTVGVACIVCIIPLGDYLFYGRIETGLYTVEQWLAVPIIAIVGGLLGGLFAQAVASVTPRISAMSRQRPYVVAGWLGLALGVLGLISGGLTYGSGFIEAQRILIEGGCVSDLVSLPESACQFRHSDQWNSRWIVRPKPLGGCRTRATDSSGLSRHQPAGGDSPHHGSVFLRSGAKPAHLGRDLVRDDCLAPHGPAAPRHLDPGLRDVASGLPNITV